MSFSQSAASTVVPLIARLVLAAVFIPAGYHKIMDTVDFSGDDARRLRELRVVETDSNTPIRFATLMQDAPSTPAAAAPSTTPPTTVVPSKPTTDESVKPAAIGTPPSPGGEPLKAKALHRITLMVDKMGWGNQVILGWTAAMTELVGGALIFVGLFSRIWALGLAIAMAAALKLTSIESYTSSSGFFHDLNVNDYHRFAAQLALFALAFGVLLTGAGGFSFDRLMFRGSSSHGATKKPAEK